jgi:hypothetical protein
MKFKDLPKLGEKLDGGIFAGLTTRKDGTHHAVVLLPSKCRNLNWGDAKAWAAKQGGELPSRSVAALLFANVKDQLRPGEHWMSDEDGSHYAWYYDFGCDFQNDRRKSYTYSAVAVRLIALED